MTEEGLWEYVKNVYYKEYWTKAYEDEKKKLVDGYWYEIDCPQCEPFLTEIDSIRPITEMEIIELNCQNI